MYKNYKVVCNSAAGRRRYMQYLVPSIISSDIIDRYDIWINTMDLCDIEFFRKLAEKYKKVNLVYQPDGIIDGVKSINAFYRTCIDEDTIYLRLDDDVIWVEPDFFDKIIKFRVENPDYFVISPLVINNPKSTYILSLSGKLQLDKYYNSETFHNLFWRDGDFAYELHSQFIEKYLKTDRYGELYCGVKPIGITRFSINSICWFGKDLKQCNGIVEDDEEEFMSCVLPTKLGKSSCYYCDAIIAHFAFYTQRERLDKMDILNKYGEFIHSYWAGIPEMAKIDTEIQSIMKYVNDNRDLIMRGNCLYKLVVHKTDYIDFLQKWLPPVIFKKISKYKHRGKKYILNF